MRLDDVPRVIRNIVTVQSVFHAVSPDVVSFIRSDTELKPRFKAKTLSRDDRI